MIIVALYSLQGFSSKGSLVASSFAIGINEIHTSWLRSEQDLFKLGVTSLRLVPILLLYLALSRYNFVVMEHLFWQPFQSQETVERVSSKEIKSLI